MAFVVEAEVVEDVGLEVVDAEGVFGEDVGEAAGFASGVGLDGEDFWHAGLTRYACRLTQPFQGRDMGGFTQGSLEHSLPLMYEPTLGFAT